LTLDLLQSNYADVINICKTREAKLTILLALETFNNKLQERKRQRKSKFRG